MPNGFGIRTYPLLDRNIPVAAIKPQASITQPAPQNTNAVTEPAVAQKPVTLIRAFQNSAAVPGPRNQDSPAKIAASLSQLTPQQQVENLNSLSPYNAAKVLSNLDQDQLDRIMSQPGLNADLLGQLKQFITPESYANLTKNWSADRIAAALEYPDLTPEARGQILQNTPQASGVFKNLINANPQAALESFQNLTRIKQTEILSQLDPDSLTALLGTGENNTFFSLLSTENKSAVISRLSETNPDLARNYLYDNASPVVRTDIDVAQSRLADGSQNDANHPALLVNGLNQGQLDKVLTSLDPSVVAAILADPQLDAGTRALIVNNFKKTFSRSEGTADPMRSANINNTPLSPQQHFADRAIIIYGAFDPEGAQALLSKLETSIGTLHKNQRNTALKNLCAMDPSSAGALLAQPDSTVAQTAVLLNDATAEQREKLLSALTQANPQKAQQTKEMLSLLQQAEQKKQNEQKEIEKLRGVFQNVGPEKVAAWLANNATSDNINALFIMDDGYIDKTISYLEKSSPKTAEMVKQQRAKTKEQAGAVTSDEDAYKTLLAKTPQDTALILADKDATTARTLLAGLKARDASYADKTLKELEKYDSQLAKEVQKPAPAAPRLSQNQFGQAIKIEGEDVYSVVRYSDGTVRMSKIGKAGDSPETIEALPGQTFSEDDALRPIRTSALTKSPDGTDDPSQVNYDPSQHDVSFDPNNDVLSTPYAVYPKASANIPSNWKTKQSLILNGKQLTTTEPISGGPLIDPKTGDLRANSVGTEFTDEKNNRYAIVVSERGKASLERISPIQVTKGTQTPVTFADGTKHTLTAESDFALTRDVFEDGYAGEYHAPSSTLFRDENGDRWMQFYDTWKRLDFDASDDNNRYGITIRLPGNNGNRKMVAVDPIYLQPSDQGPYIPDNPQGYTFFDVDSRTYWKLNDPTATASLSDGNGNTWSPLPRVMRFRVIQESAPQTGLTGTENEFTP